MRAQKHSVNALLVQLQQQLDAPHNEGLAEALGRAHVILLCAQVPALWAAHAAAPIFFAAARCAVLVYTPEQLVDMGSGLWQAVDLKITWQQQASMEAQGSHAQLARTYCCPQATLMASAPEPSAVQPWALHVKGFDATTQLAPFAVDYAAWALVALWAGNNRLKKSATTASMQPLRDFCDAYAAVPAHKEAIVEAVRAAPQAAKWAAVCKDAVFVEIRCDAASYAGAAAYAQRACERGPALCVAQGLFKNLQDLQRRGEGTAAVRLQIACPEHAGCSAVLTLFGPHGLSFIQLPPLSRHLWPLWVYFALEALLEGCYSEHHANELGNAASQASCR